jgi:hypothetical protein
MQKIFKLNNEGDRLTVDINSNKKVNIQVGDEEVNFFLGNPSFNNAEMEYMYNFLEHRLAASLAVKIHNEVGAIVGYPKRRENPPVDMFGQEVQEKVRKRPFAHRKSTPKSFYIRAYDRQSFNTFYDETRIFNTKEAAEKHGKKTAKPLSGGRKFNVIVTRA